MDTSKINWINPSREGRVKADVSIYYGPSKGKSKVPTNHMNFHQSGIDKIEHTDSISIGVINGRCFVDPNGDLLNINYDKSKSTANLTSKKVTEIILTLLLGSSFRPLNRYKVRLNLIPAEDGLFELVLEEKNNREQDNNKLEWL